MRLRLRGGRAVVAATPSCTDYGLASWGMWRPGPDRAGLSNSASIQAVRWLAIKATVDL